MNKYEARLTVDIELTIIAADIMDAGKMAESKIESALYILGMPANWRITRQEISPTENA